MKPNRNLYLALSQGRLQHLAFSKQAPILVTGMGFSLIEVLVALLVLSVGLLGLAALQTVGLKYNHQSYQRTQAVLQTYDIADRIRANPTGKMNSCYDNVALGATATTGGCAVAFRDCESNACTPNELANYDISKWNTANAALLAGGRGSIATAAGTARRTITITWSEDNQSQSQTLEVDL